MLSEIDAHQPPESAAHQPLALAAHHLFESGVRSIKDCCAHQVSTIVDSGAHHLSANRNSSAASYQ